MIEIRQNKTIHLVTENTSYLFSITDSGYPEHIYYGKRLKNPDVCLSAIREKHLVAPVMSTIANREEKEITLNDTLLEFSTEGKGDYKTPMVAISYGEEKERTLNLEFIGYAIHKGIRRFSSSLVLPQAIGTESEADTLEIVYKDKVRNIKLIQYYTTFNNADVITRRSTIVNESFENITLRALYSGQLDLRTENAECITFQGAWARERNEVRNKITRGSFYIESRTLESSLDANPAFYVLNGKDTYLMNLMYSGSHRATFSQTGHGLTHIVWGINEAMFSWPLVPSEFFESPEAVMIYSDKGIDGARDLSHRFVQKHVRRGAWRDRLKPLMFNTWEGSYFDIDEDKIANIAANAKDIGAEGLVIDDGWFGARYNDKTSLGDWYANTMKFPSGLANTSAEVHRLGMIFGLWVEPEAISEKSNLRDKHPDWIIGRKPETNAIGRNQMLLDLTRDDVQDWIIATLSSLIEVARVDYLKWDMNRSVSDIYSHRPIGDYGKFAHKYITGLYRILKTLTQRYPNLYIEGCASGGGRFDLGMLSYCPSIWTSDCSDPIERLKITEGTAMVYPLSVMGVSVSPSPNFHTKRIVDLETRFNTSVFGVLNYSVEAEKLEKAIRSSYKQQIEFYKNYRLLLQFGTFRVQESNNRTIWTISNNDASTIIVLYLQKEARINTSAEKLYIECANENYEYRFFARDHYQSEIEASLYPQEPECYNISGDALKWAGITLMEQYSGNGYKDGMRVLGDFSSRLYLIKKVEEK